MQTPQEAHRFRFGSTGMWNLSKAASPPLHSWFLACKRQAPHQWRGKKRAARHADAVRRERVGLAKQARAARHVAARAARARGARSLAISDLRKCASKSFHQA
jgi:hypothetical protein